MKKNQEGAEDDQGKRLGKGTDGTFQGGKDRHRLAPLWLFQLMTSIWFRWRT